MRVEAQAPVLQLAGTVPERPEAVKSTMEAALSPAKSPRVPTSQAVLNTLGPSWEMILQVARAAQHVMLPEVKGLRILLAVLTLYWEAQGVETKAG